MHGSLNQFRQTALARELDALIADPRRYQDFVAQSLLGKPAVTALQQELQRRFGNLDHVARRYTGAKTAEVMRGRGHGLIKKRSRVPGGYFTYGAVFSPRPLAAAGSWDAFFAAGPAEDFPERGVLQPAAGRQSLDA